MAFVRVNKTAASGRNSNVEIRMGWHKQSSATASRGIYFAVHQALAIQAGWTLRDVGNDRVSCKVGVMEGTHEDAGFLLLVEDTERGYVLGTNKGSAAGRSSLGMSVATNRMAHYVLNNVEEEQTPAPVDFTVDEKEHTILIQCPDWLRYNPQSVSEPEPVVEVKKEPARPPTVHLTVVKEDNGEEVYPNRHQRRKITKKIAQALRA